MIHFEDSKPFAHRLPSGRIALVMTPETAKSVAGEAQEQWDENPGDCGAVEEVCRSFARLGMCTLNRTFTVTLDVKLISKETVTLTVDAETHDEAEEKAIEEVEDCPSDYFTSDVEEDVYTDTRHCDVE